MTQTWIGSERGAAGRGAGSPYLSVIVPVHNGAGVLRDTLGALAASELPREAWELIVVDDASEDDSALLAARYADTVVRLPGSPRGPAYARNRGFEVARGEWLVFLDADVRVHPDTLRRFVQAIRKEGDVGAIFGSYDDRPPAPGIVSRFRNLMHHYVHQQNAGAAETFWAGCGAVRREVFAEAGLYDEWHYPRPEIEDIELGRRILSLGHRIVLRPEIQVTHLKRWTLGSVLRTDFRRRGVPWTRLLLQEGPSAASRALNLRASEKLCTAAVAAGAGALVAAAVTREASLLWIPAAVVGLVVAFNCGFYRTLARCCGWWFPLVALPLHLAYYLGNTLSAVTGWLAHNLVGEPLPSAAVVAFHEIGIKTWPPVPSRPERSLWSAETAKETQRDRPRARGEPDAEAAELALAFLPLHKRAFGIAVGTVAAVGVSGITLFDLVLQRRGPTLPLGLLAQYFQGYTVSWQGALIGGCWAFFVGFVAGWFLAFCRNLAIATSVFLARSREELSGGRGFLDHI